MKTRKRYLPILLISLAAIIFMAISLFSSRPRTDKDEREKSKEPLKPVLDLSFSGKENSKEPLKPALEPGSGSEEQPEIETASSLWIKEAFAAIRDDPSIMVSDEKLREEILYAFKDNRSEAIELSMQYLQLPVVEIVRGRRVDRAMDFDLARNILQVFSDEAVPELIELYKNSNAVTRGNVIHVLGGMPVDLTIANARDLLIGALDDQSSCESELPATLVAPLRVCDMAYNQLVLRYHVKDVPRTIGTAHKIEDRDYYIETLKGIFAGVVGKDPIL